jgi:putative Mn2+ efflux pump MntP
VPGDFYIYLFATRQLGYARNMKITRRHALGVATVIGVSSILLPLFGLLCVARFSRPWLAVAILAIHSALLVVLGIVGAFMLLRAHA